MSSIFEVAKQAGVSASTVSRTFNSPHLINDKTKKLVFEAAERVNYQPRRQRIPVETPEPAYTTLRFHFFAERPEDTLQRNAFYSQVLAGALSEASDLNIRLILSTSDRHGVSSTPSQSPESLAAAGILLVGAIDADTVARFADSPNIVFIDTHDTTGAYDSVVSDNFGGAYTATKHLIGLGHKRIGFVTGLDPVVSFAERMNGYVCAHFHAGIPLDNTLTITKGHDSIKACLERSDRPTAILGANDECAIDTMQVCQQLGICIPRDLSLIGFDDLEFTARVLPALTSVHVPTETIGRLGVRRLYAKIQNSANPALVDLPSCSVVPVRLVERESCAPPLGA